MNLIEDAWIPIRRRNGETGCIAPGQITSELDSNPIVGFGWARAELDAASFEFLIGLLSSAAPPDDEDEWHEAWHQPPTPEELTARLLEHRAAFAMNEPGPQFMQELETLETAKRESVSKLLFDSPGHQTVKQNSDVFVRRGRYSQLGIPATAIALHALNLYATGGGVGHRTSLRGIGVLTTLVVGDHPRWGDSVWTRVWPNVETIKQIEARGGTEGNPIEQVYPWMVPTRQSDPKKGGKRTYPEDVHPLQVYWAMPRRTKIEFSDEPEQCNLTGDDQHSVCREVQTKNYGAAYAQEHFRHPLSPYYKDEKERVMRPMHTFSDAIQYQNWPRFLGPQPEAGFEPATAVWHWRTIRSIGIGAGRAAAHGVQIEKTSKVVAWLEGEIPIWQAKDRDQQLRIDSEVSKLVKSADKAAALLSWCISEAEKPKPVSQSEVRSAFFERTEPDVEERIEAIVQQQPDEAFWLSWMALVTKKALAQYDVHAGETALEVRRPAQYATGRKILSLVLKGYGKKGVDLYQNVLQIRAPGEKPSE